MIHTANQPLREASNTYETVATVTAALCKVATVIVPRVPHGTGGIAGLVQTNSMVVRRTFTFRADVLPYSTNGRTFNRPGNLPSEGTGVLSCRSRTPTSVPDELKCDG
ncbi:hypothetical protein EVJ58_g10506 [Rhodofomes roseus]|uniref:Uncharacterized protein n=1 Tax=Rhodofomes roseus TaxID=34475 RepID=A0A4Y9XN81_9APHY|nr:hypothetical protein EVJ58_g10506 [Rhodofomes roseus]